MTDQVDVQESDLSYLRRLISAGRGEPAPLLLLMAVFGGGYGLAAASLYCLNLFQPGWIEAGHRGAWFEVFRWSLLAAHVAFIGTLGWTIWLGLRGRHAPLNRAASAIWTSALIGFVTAVAAAAIFARSEPSSDAVYSIYLLGPFLLVLWGCAWWATAFATDRPWLVSVALGSFVAAGVSAFAGNSLEAVLVAAASLWLLAFVPAIALMRWRR